MPVFLHLGWQGPLESLDLHRAVSCAPYLLHIFGRIAFSLVQFIARPEANKKCGGAGDPPRKSRGLADPLPQVKDLEPFTHGTTKAVTQDEGTVMVI